MGQLTFDSGRQVGHTPGVFVIAEAGVNHNGDLALAHDLVDAAAKAGADAVKFQTFEATRLVAPTAPKAEYQKKGDAAATQLEMLRALELGLDAHRELKAYAESQGLVFLSSPFDVESVDLLVELGVDALKLGSGELTNVELLRHAATRGLPLILSTGMAYLSEIDEAVRRVRAWGLEDLAILHCVSLYPTPPEDVHLRAMAAVAGAAPGALYGFSDHTDGVAVSVAAVARGAQIIEKHLTCDRGLPGPDHAASLEPDTFAQMVSMIREVEQALGRAHKAPVAGESEMRHVARRSLHVRRDVESGEVLKASDLAVWRPASGLAPELMESVIGMRVHEALCAGDPLTWAALGRSDA